MAGLRQDKAVLPGEILRLLDEPLTDSDLQSSVSDVNYTQAAVLQGSSDN
jgi:hypothetical protein